MSDMEEPARSAQSQLADDIDSRAGKQRAGFWVLDALGRYRAASPNEDDVYYSAVLEGFWLDTNWLWQEPLMNPLLAFAQVCGIQELMRMMEYKN